MCYGDWILPHGDGSSLYVDLLNNAILKSAFWSRIPRVRQRYQETFGVYSLPQIQRRAKVVPCMIDP